ncbi:MAG: hypothetical protein JXR88_05305 [Clostridia bacterium]|nr:hypothetical protein [Clostridia bacterium]
MKRFKKIAVALFITLLMIQILLHFDYDETLYNTASQSYYVENGLEETSSKNLVTAIYLDYRLFDSFFEASLLLIVVTGIAFMTIKDEDML